VRLINLDEGDRVVAVAKLAEPEDVEDEAQAELPGATPEPPAAGPGAKTPKAPFLDDEE
jgi:hypothetical protein